MGGGGISVNPKDPSPQNRLAIPHAHKKHAPNGTTTHCSTVTYLHRTGLYEVHKGAEVFQELFSVDVDCQLRRNRSVLMLDAYA